MSVQPSADLAIVEPMREVTEPTTGALQRLEAEALAMDKAYKIAKGLAATPMVPEHFQTAKNGEAAMWSLAAAIMYGAELGLSAVQSAQNIFIVKGRPAVYARTMAAQVRRAGYRLEEVEASDERVIWKGERDGKWASSEWTMERAAQAQYTKNDRYKTNPQEMLRAKCIAEVCRIQYQDVLLGMAYSVEELQLESVSVQRVVRQQSVNKGAALLREIAKSQADSESQPEPRIEQELNLPNTEQPVASGSTDEASPAPTTAQLDEIRKRYKAQQNLSGQAMLDEIALFLQLDHKLTSLAKLSYEDAQAVLDDALHVAAE